MKTFRGIVRRIIDIIFTLIIGIVLVALVTNYMGYKTYIVRSGSMEPAIHTAAVAIVNENKSFYDIEIGDIVAFKLQTGELVTHRAIEETKIDGITYFMTKGDNNDMADGFTVNIQNYYGETIYSIPGLGYFMDWFMSPQGRIVAIGLGIGLILLYVLMQEEEEKEAILVPHAVKVDKDDKGRIILTGILADGLNYVPDTALIDGQKDVRAKYDQKNREIRFAPFEVDEQGMILEFDATNATIEYFDDDDDDYDDEDEVEIEEIIEEEQNVPKEDWLEQ